MNKAIVEYETSLGLETIEFDNGENITVDVDEDKKVVFIEERMDGKKFNKELAIISLESFVSFSIKPIKEEDSKLEGLCKAVSDCLFENKDKYNPYTKVVITDEGVEINEGTQGFTFKRYEGGEENEI